MYQTVAVNKKLVELEIKNMKLVLTMFNDVRKIITDFDNKTLNKRLDSALKTINKNIHVTQQYNSIEILYRCEERFFQENGNTHYIKYDRITFADGCMASSYNDEVLTDDRRIIASRFLKFMDKQENYLRKQIAEMTEQLERIETIIAQRNKILKTMKDFNESINYTIRDYFGLSFDIYSK